MKGDHWRKAFMCKSHLMIAIYSKWRPLLFTCLLWARPFRNLRTFFSRVKNALSCIFLLNSIVTEMPYLPKMNLFLWTTFLSKGFKNGIIQRFWRFLNSDCMAWTQHFTFAGFRKKGNSLGTLIVIFDNVSPKGFFSDWIWRISKFQFWRRILIIYRPLRVRIWSLTGGIESGASQTVGLGV